LAADRQLLSLHHNLRRLPLLAAAEELPEPRGDRAIGLGVFAAGLGDDDWIAAIRGLEDRDIERQLAKEFDPELLCLGLGAAMAEDIRALAAMRAEEVAHIL